MSFRILLTIFLFVIRAFATGVSQVVFVYTPEVYPTTVRAFALGTCAAAAHIGAIVTPFAAQVSFLSHRGRYGQWGHLHTEDGMGSGGTYIQRTVWAVAVVTLL